MHNLIEYNSNTGKLYWKVSRGGRLVGAEAGSVHHEGYIRVGILNKVYAAHRLIWFLYYGDWPKYQIDHINGVKTDNRITNLRDVDQNKNQQNQIGARRDSTNGLRGVDFHKSSNKWRARLFINKTSIHIGLYNSKEEAHDAYLESKLRLHDAPLLIK